MKGVALLGVVEAMEQVEASALAARTLSGAIGAFDILNSGGPC